MMISNNVVRRLTYAIVFGAMLNSFTVSAQGTKVSTVTKRLACFYYDKTNPHDGIGFFQPGLPFVWAKGLTNENIYIEGSTEDGFFTAQKVKGKTRGILGLRQVAKYENDESLAQLFCTRGLKAAFPDSSENKVMIHIGAKASFLSVNHYPLVFQNQTRPLLGSINKLVVFGDSLSDQGNLKNWLRIFPQAPYFAGRFSNRQIWVDYVQQMTGIAVQNWAYAGSISNPFYQVNLANRPWRERFYTRAQIRTSGHIQREIRRFERKSLHGGSITNAESTLFSLWIGANDYLRVIESDDDSDIFLDQPNNGRLGYRKVVDLVTDNMIGHIKHLYELGGRHFFVANLPDFGKSPRMLGNTSYHRNVSEEKETKLVLLSAKVSNVVSLHNQVLRNKLLQLEQSFPDLHLIFGDAATIEKRALLSIDLQDGISFFNYDFDKKFFVNFPKGEHTVTIGAPCFAGNPIDPRNKNICAEPDRAPFWDDLHPTSFGHCLLAAYFHQQAAQQNALLPTTANEYFKLCRPELAYF